MSGPRKSGGCYLERIVDNIIDIAPADYAKSLNFFHPFAQRATNMFTSDADRMVS